ncbi:MAG: hypothetical protein R6V11_03395 [Ectothiorhodospiraceae bacterium]
MSDPVNIFWTGGWDSTFRVMELLHLTDRPIQPHYVIDPRRRSSEMEIRTMERITRALIEGGFAEEERIRPLKTHRREEIPHDDAIDQAFREITRTHRVGNQYRWLAMLVKGEGLDGIELGIERGSIYPVVNSALTALDQKLHTKTVAPNSGSVSALFGRYSLPLIERGDAELRRHATESGWDRILAHTCFCHSPLLGRYPCGTCRPCMLMIERKGEGNRVGWRGKLRYWLVERPIRLLPKSIVWRIRQHQESRAASKNQSAA